MNGDADTTVTMHAAGDSSTMEPARASLSKPPVAVGSGDDMPTLSKPPLSNGQPNAPKVSATDSDTDQPLPHSSWRLSAWLVSMILHTIVLIALVLWTYGEPGGGGGIGLEGSFDSAGPTVTLESVPQENETIKVAAAEAERPVNVDLSPRDHSQIAQPVINPMAATPVDASVANLIKAGGDASSDRRLILLPGGGLAGRTPEGRKKLGEKYGASGPSEEALEKALQWLALHQRPNGSWSFDLSLDPCNGRCRHSNVADDTPTPSTGATGLALLAFLGAGYTHQSGKHAETVRRGIYYLRSVYAESEFGFDWQEGSMYGHGIALLALSEALAMTKNGEEYDSDLMHLVEKGSYFTVVAQHPNGSWGYNPGSPGDTTVTGWQVLSLVGVKRCGIHLRSDTLAKAKAFLMSVKQEHDYAFGYKEPDPEPTMTAIALTLMMYLGQTPGYTLFDDAIDEMSERGPTLTNVYHDYYATMAMHHWRHRDWDRWNTKLRDHLVRSQETAGHEAGSWHFQDKWGNIGGRLYTTAMCALTLEVYYRYLPLYEKPDEFPL